MQGSILLQISQKRRTIRVLFLIFLLSLVFPMVLAPIAEASKKYGPIASPGTAWRDDIVLNGNEGRQTPYPEMTAIDCKDPATGKPLTSAQTETIRKLSEYSLQIYLGNFKTEDVFGKINLGDQDEVFKDSVNYGMKMGKNGFNQFLKGEVKLLRTKLDPRKADLEEDDIADSVKNLATRVDPTRGIRNLQDLLKSQGASSECNSKACLRSAWSKFDKRSLNSNSEEARDIAGVTYPWSNKGGATAYVDINGNASDAWEKVGDYTDTWKMSPQEGVSVANMINPNAGFPTAAFAKVPAGCPIASWTTTDGMGLGDFFGDIAYGFVSLLLAVPSLIVDVIYNFVYPIAWKYAFFTPHTERGDTIFNMETTCTPGQDSCSGFKELGFSKKNLKGSGSDKPLFIKLTSMIQWMLSGTYFLILFSSAVLFIFRGKSSQTLQLMKVAPRLAMVLMFTFAVPFLMGAIISLSNLIVMSVLGFGQPGGAGGSLAKASVTMSLMGAFFADSGNSLMYPIIKLATGIAATIASVMVLASVYIRQIILIVLVVIAPVAIFCLIVDSWKPHFKRWLRVFFIVTFFPVILGIILKIGMLLNPIFNLSERSVASFDQADAVTAFVMLIITFWAMGRAVKMAQGMMGNPGGGGLGAVGGIMGQLGQGLRGSRYTAPLGMALGAAGYGMGRASQAPSGLKEALVPAGRGSMAGTPLLGGAGGAPAGGGPPGLPGKVGNSLNERFNRFAEKGAARKAERSALRKDTMRDWMNGDRKFLGTTGPRDWLRRGVNTYIPRKKGGWLDRKLEGAATYSRQIDAAKAEEMIRDRNERVRILRRNHSRGEAERLVSKEMGSVPRQKADGTWHIRQSKEQHEAGRTRDAIRSAQRSFEHGKLDGDRAELVRSGHTPTGEFDAKGNPEYKRGKVAGAHMDDFIQELKNNGQTMGLSDHDLKQLIIDNASSNRRN